MDKFKLFLIVNGAVVGLLLLFFARLYGKRRENHFREDIWKEKPKLSRAELRASRELQVDTKILLAAPEEAKASFKLPNFRGQPHEILGVDADASAEQISAAHKYWIKRYHPDRVEHLGKTYVEQAKKRSEQLNSARQELLLRVKKST